MGQNTTKKSHLWLIITGLLILSVVLFLALFPSIISSQWGKEKALNIAAPHIPGKARIDDWSLSWFGEQRLTGISYVDPDTGVQIDSSKITIAKGLAPFLLARDNVGTVIVTQPNIQISLPEPAPKGAEADPAAKSDKTPINKVEAPQTTIEKKPATAPATLPAISARLLVEQGTIAVARPEKATEPVARDINVEINIVSENDPITYSLAMISPDGAGKISGSGTIELQGTDTTLAALHPAGELQIRGWNISQFIEIAAVYAAIPAGSGILDSKISFDGTPNEPITIDGTIDLSSLELSGGPLGDDHPFVEKTSVVFSASSDLNTLELSSLTLSSPLANGSLDAVIDAEKTLQFNTDLNVNLQAVANQIPQTLGLQEGLQITGGVLGIQAKADLGQGENSFVADARIEGLAGVRNSKTISLTEPFSFSLNGQRGKNGITLEHFSVHSSFLNGEGQGNLDDMQLSLDADLGDGLHEISKFISLQDYQADGHLTISFEALRKDDAQVGLVARLAADKLVVKQGKSTVIPPSQLKLDADATLLLSRDFVPGGVAEAQMNYQSWLGHGSLTGREIMLDPDRKLESIKELVADGQLKLHDLGIMLQSLGILPDSFNLDGDSHFQFKVSGTDEQLIVKDLLLDSPKISLQKGTALLIPESALRLNGSCKVGLGDDGGVATVNNPTLGYNNWLGSGTVQAESVDIPTKLANNLVFAGKTDLGKLSALLSGLELLPPDLSFSGTETSRLTMNYSPEQIHLASLHTEVSDFILKQQGKTYQDKQLIVDTAGTINMAKRQASFNPVHINSANGAVSLEQLAVEDWDNPLDTINTMGQAQFDLNSVLNAAADWINLPPEISTAATVDLNWSVDAHSSAEHSYRLSADLSSFNLARAELQALSDEDVSVRINGLRNSTTGQVTVEQVHLTSPPLNFNAAGLWKTSADNITELSFTGNSAMDLTRIATLIRTFSEIDIEMAGKSDRPFELGIKVNPEQRQKWWQHTDFSSAFQADLIKILGIELSSIEIPVSVSDGYAQAEIKGTANQGALLLQPQLDLMSNPPVLTIPDNSRILDKMQITPEMADQLLARIHPLFMGATQMSGVFDLDLEQFNWPLGKENLNDLQFAGSMDFHDVHLDSSALLGTLLTVLRIEETGIDLSERQITFVCSDGRIETNQLRTKLSDSELVIGGSLGLDTTIDYLASAEVTEHLVGGDLYNLLEGTTIHIPIGGTLSSPDISAKTVQRTVQDLINQAGQKKLQDAAGSLLKRLF